MNFPPRNAPVDQRLDALADLLSRLPIEFEGVRLNGTIVQDLRDAAITLRARTIETRTTPRPSPRRAGGRWNYG